MTAPKIRAILAIIVGATFLVFMPVRPAATLGTQPNSQDPEEERQLEDTTPKHVPIRVRIKPTRVKSFKDMKNDRWLRELEIEVRNTGTKPIYLLVLVLDTPDTLSPSGNPFGWSFVYGRSDLISITESIKTEDVPLQPGETYTFSIAERFVGAWEKFVKEGTVEQPKKVRMIFQFINFGDGTGLWNASGEPLPHPKRPGE